ACVARRLADGSSTVRSRRHHAVVHALKRRCEANRRRFFSTFVLAPPSIGALPGVAMSFIWKLLWLVFFAVGCFGPLQSSRADVERTRASDELIKYLLPTPGAINDVSSRRTLASLILNYCTETSKHLPRNSQKEDEEIEKYLLRSI